MSQHPSLKSDTKGKAHRSVWKRFERLKFLVDKDKWNEGDSIFGLVKMKLLKIKIKKEKAADATAEDTAAEGAVAAEGAAAAPDKKVGGAAVKGPTAKTAAGKDDTKDAKKHDKK